MNPRSWDRLARRRALALVVLAAGLAGAAWVYAAALEAEAQDNPQGYSSALLMSPEYSKKFLRDLEVYGGKANVLMFKFRAWLEGLFQGRSLAYVMAGLSLLISAALFLGGCRGPGRAEPPGPRPD